MDRAGRTLAGTLSLHVRALLFIDRVSDFLNTPTFLSDSGVLPRSAVFNYVEAGQTWCWSLYFLNGSVAFAVLLQLLHMGSLCSLVVGWHARKSAAIALILQISQNSRTRMLTTGFDDLIVGLLFCMISLPIADTASVDAVDKCLDPLRRGDAWSVMLGANRSSAADRPLVFNIGTMALSLQVWILYFCSAHSKTDRAWLVDHTALQLTLQLGFFARPWSVLLLHHGTLCQMLTALVVPIEYILPVFLLLPSLPVLNFLRVASILGLLGLLCGAL